MAHVTEKAVSCWNQSPAFRLAVYHAIKRGLQQTPWLFAELASAARARRGSIRDWELYLQAGGPTSWRGPIDFRPDAADSDAVPGATVNVQNNYLVQRVDVVGIPERQPVETLPPAMTLPAAVVAQPLTPAQK